MRMNRKLALLLGTGIGLVASQAAAQDVPPPAGVPPQSVNTGTDENPDTAQKTTADASSDIVVTGSRVITNGNNSPTPVTVISTEQLAATTPTNVPDALNKLPTFGNSRSVVTLGNSGANNVGNYLNLRGFGIIRTLILFDGKRVPATNADGTVDTNVLPQMLMQRVDVVTGGASAVYGSDAVTGVVNFIVDTKFNGLKVQAQSGISRFGDAFSWRAGFAAGTDLFGGRGHFEGSYEHFRQDGIDDKFARPAGQRVYSETGAGTAANPFRLSIDTRNNNSTFGGLFLTGPLAYQRFASDGVLVPFVHGAATGTNGIESGGDGSYLAHTSLTADLDTDQAFGRFDFDVTDDMHFYVQTNLAQSKNQNNFAPFGITNNTFSSANPYLTPAIRGALAGTSTFQFSHTYANLPTYITQAQSENVHVTTGLSGKLGTFDWQGYFTHGETHQIVASANNINLPKFYAALDAVDQGTFNTGIANGNIVCRVSLTNPGLYPGCVPFNPFVATPSDASVDYVRERTQFRLVNKMDDFGASIAGSPFATWAGPVQVALSGEYRKVSVSNRSTADPRVAVNCTGLRYNCTAATPQYGSNTVADVDASQEISEGAFEANVPLLSGVRFFDALNVNGAVRYAHYSVSGNATTWKVGVDWHLSDELSLRATRSRDVRAPTLYDLFAPLNVSQTGFTDLHTGTSGVATLRTQGNPDLDFEKAKTWTAGGVYKPHWLEGFSLAVDYYSIKIDNAITTIGGNNAQTQAQCEASGGTDPLCNLYVRPLPFSDRTAANYPTFIRSTALNVAQTRTEGVDFEANYNRPVGAGRVSLRGLLTYQPILKTIQFTGAIPINYAGVAGQQGVLGQAKWRATLFAGYSTDEFSIDVQERWRSSLAQNGNPVLVYRDPRVPAVAYTDLTLTFHPGGDKNKSMFLSINNLLDKEAPVFISSAFGSNPNFFYPAVGGDDIFGRYFTFGTRLRF